MPSYSAPGKLILIGEHAAVYGRPALVAAAGLRLTATITAGDGDGRVRLRASGGRSAPGAPSGVHELATSWEAIHARTAAARGAWEVYAAGPGPATMSALAGGLAARTSFDLVQLALGEAALAAGDGVRSSSGAARSASLPSIVLSVASEIPVGSGFGSSAAAAVAVVAAYLAVRGIEPAPALLHRVSLEVERRQHGSPSGVDNATVLYGGVLWARRSDAGGVDFAPVAAGSPFLSRLRIYGSGPPAETTGAVVAGVRALYDRDRRGIERVLDRLAELTAALRRELAEPAERPDRVVAIVREAHECLERLGVVPEPVCALVRAIEARGGAAKISGAGSLAGPGGGNLIVYHPHPEELAGWPPLAALDHYPVALGVEGLRCERSPPEPSS